MLPAKMEAPNATTITVLIMGKTGSGKSTCGNVLSNSTYFREAFFGVSGTRDWHLGVFSLEGQTLRIVDTIGFEDTHITEEEVVSNLIDGCKILGSFHHIL